MDYDGGEGVFGAGADGRALEHRRVEVDRRARDFVHSDPSIRAFAQPIGSATVDVPNNRVRVYLALQTVTAAMFAAAARRLPESFALRNAMVPVAQRDGKTTLEQRTFIEASLDGRRIEGGGSALRERVRRIDARLRADPQRNWITAYMLLCFACALVLYARWRGYHEPYCAITPALLLPTMRRVFRRCLVVHEA